MILGHFGLALAAKRVAPNTSTGVTTLAAQLADLVWPILLLTGTEQVRIAPHIMPASSFDFVHYPWTHSLAMQLVWGALLGGIYFALRRDGRGALIVGALVPSHWLLDFLVHRPDLPLWPGGPRVGLNGWSSVPLTLALEAVIFVPSIYIYLRATKARDRIGSIMFWVYIAFLVALYASTFVSPPPPDAKMAATMALTMWILVPWAAWFDRHREAR